MNISKSNVEQFYQSLLEKEHSRHTAEKYRRDALGLVNWLNGTELTKEKALAYKKALMENYQVRSVNSMLSSVNASFAFWERRTTAKQGDDLRLWQIEHFGVLRGCRVRPLECCPNL